MRAHALFIAALLAVAAIYAEPSNGEEPCDRWTKPIAAVATAWSAAQICDHPKWKKGSALLHALSMGADLNLYPWETIREPACIAFIQDVTEEAGQRFTSTPEACANVNSWLEDKSMRAKMLGLGLVN